MSVIDFPTTPQPPDWLVKYFDRGFRLIFYAPRKKGPEGQEALKWTERADTIEDWARLAAKFNGHVNVGTFTGHEISPGKYLADIDFDWSDGLILAKQILPATSFGFGRASRAISHSFYTTPEPLVSKVFDNIDGKPFVELRGTKQDGMVGLQTMMPPSIHPSEEEVKLLMDGEIGHVEDLPRRAALYATACMLFSVMGQRGLIHDNRMAVAGFLLTEGCTPVETELVGCAVTRACGNNVEDFKLIVKTTAARLKANEPVNGRSSLIKVIGEDGKKVVARIKEWLGGAEFLENSKGQVLANSQENVRMALEKMEVQVTFDQFAQKSMVNGSMHKGPLVDTVVRELWLRTDRQFKFRPSKDFFFDVVEDLAYSNPYHPVRAYLEQLVWDGEPRINEWLIKAGGAADSEYTREVSKIMLIAAVRRVTQPGCKYDEMVVLESGAQGLLKSTALRTLCPYDAWFSDDLPLNVDAKQIVERTLGKWIIEASDLSGMQASQVEHLKGMLSRQVDGPVRLAYGRLPVEQPRQFIIVGTTNSYNYLTDSTGNRRFWPIRVQRFDIDWLRETRDQLWAEAYAREQKGESIRLDPSLYSFATFQQERRRIEDPWEIKLDDELSRDVQHRLTWDEIWNILGISIDRRDPKATKRVTDAMARLGFRKTTVRRDQKIVKGYARDIEIGQADLDLSH